MFTLSGFEIALLARNPGFHLVFGTLLLRMLRLLLLGDRIMGFASRAPPIIIGF